MDKNLGFTEKDLDKALDEGFKHSSEFSKWFLSKTRFSKLNATYNWSRSDNPWGRFTFDVDKKENGKIEQITRDSETDVLVIFEDELNNKFALHIENKLANGKFTQYQPEFYSKRAEAWANNEKFGNYTDFETVLVAPIEFYKNNFRASQYFDKYVSYQEVAILLPEFSNYLEAHTNEKT